jgi:hypothetical protein
MRIEWNPELAGGHEIVEKQLAAPGKDRAGRAAPAAKRQAGEQDGGAKRRVRIRENVSGLTRRRFPQAEQETEGRRNDRHQSGPDYSTLTFDFFLLDRDGERVVMAADGRPQIGLMGSRLEPGAARRYGPLQMSALGVVFQVAVKSVEEGPPLTVADEPRFASGRVFRYAFPSPRLGGRRAGPGAPGTSRRERRRRRPGAQLTTEDRRQRHPPATRWRPGAASADSAARCAFSRFATARGVIVR